MTIRPTKTSWRTVLVPNEAIERLQIGASRPGRIGSTAYGDLTTTLGIVGVFRRNRFDLRRQRFIASAGAVHAFGVVEGIPEGSRINVRFGRATWITWLRRGFIVYMLSLAAIGLIAALRQPVFLVGSAFIATMALLVMWSMRMRSEDIAVLHKFLEETFADVELPADGGREA